MVIHSVQESFKNPKLGRYYLIFDKDYSLEDPVCSLNITFQQDILVGGQVNWIKSVYIPHEHRGRGIYRVFYDRFIEDMKNDPHVKAVKLVVDRTNRAGISCYNKTSMSLVEKDDFYNAYTTI